MSMEDSLVVLETCKVRIDETLVAGTTTDGSQLLQFWYHDLPPSAKIEHCEISVKSCEGEGIDVVIGPGGRLIKKDYTEPEYGGCLNSLLQAISHLCRPMS